MFRVRFYEHEITFSEKKLMLGEFTTAISQLQIHNHNFTTDNFTTVQFHNYTKSQLSVSQPTISQLYNFTTANFTTNPVIRNSVFLCKKFKNFSLKYIHKFYQDS